MEKNSRRWTKSPDCTGTSSWDLLPNSRGTCTGMSLEFDMQPLLRSTSDSGRGWDTIFTSPRGADVGKSSSEWDQARSASGSKDSIKRYQLQRHLRGFAAEIPFSPSPTGTDNSPSKSSKSSDWQSPPKSDPGIRSKCSNKSSPIDLQERHSGDPNSIRSDSLMPKASTGKRTDTYSQSTLQLEIEAERRSALQAEIEAERRRIYVRKEHSSGSRGRFKEGQKLIMVTCKLPFVIEYSDEPSLPTGARFSQVLDPFYEDVKGLAQTASEESSMNYSRVVSVGVPVVRRKLDGTSVALDGFEHWSDLREYLAGFSAVPVCIPSSASQEAGYAKRVLHPLFNYLQPPVEAGLQTYDWVGYESFNNEFAKCVLPLYSSGDVVWIHDYPLMLLPKILRNQKPEMPIGIYIHAVFPTSDVYRILPQREELLRGVLSANIIGFHNFQYVRYFLTSCTRILGIECTSSGIEACEDTGGTATKVVATPVGINCQPYMRRMEEESMQGQVLALLRNIAGPRQRKVIISVDCLDQTKGIPQKFMAFHKFLVKYPQWAEACVFVQVTRKEEALDGSHAAADSGEVRSTLLRKIYQMVGEINSKFGSIGHLPVHFLHQKLGPGELIPLYACADVAIDSAVRDVLSVTAYEYLCCQTARQGVLILSEFSGSAQSLRAAAICMNPWNTVEFAEAIHEALEMNDDERIARHSYGHSYVVKHSSQHWANSFLQEFHETIDEAAQDSIQNVPRLIQDELTQAFKHDDWDHRIIILNFGGTLLPRNKGRSRAPISPVLSAQVPDVVLSNLEVLAADKNTDVIIVTSVTRQRIDEAFGKLPCWFIAEFGIYVKAPNDAQWENYIEKIDASWIRPVEEIMEYFCDRTPGSFYQTTQCSVSWHYQKTMGDYGGQQARDLMIHLWAGPLLSAPAEVVAGTNSVIVRPTEVSKSSQLESVLRRITEAKEAGETSDEERKNYFVCCIGDFIKRDEDVFTTVQKVFNKGGEKEKRMDARTDVNRRRQSNPNLRESARENDEHWAIPMRRQSNPNPEDEHWAISSTLRSHRVSSSMDSSFWLSFQDTWGEAFPGGSDDDQMYNLEANSKTLDPRMMKRWRSRGKSGEKIKSSSLEAVLQSTPNGDRERDQAKKENCVFTCTVGPKSSKAMHHLVDYEDVSFLLAKFAWVLTHPESASSM